MIKLNPANYTHTHVCVYARARVLAIIYEYIFTKKKRTLMSLVGATFIDG